MARKEEMRPILDNTLVSPPAALRKVHLSEAPRHGELISTESQFTGDSAQLDLLQLPLRRRVTASFPPSLIVRLDRTCEKLGFNRSYLMRLAVDSLVDQLEKIQARERVLEVSKRLG